MLIMCPECNKEISDKAVACPHCGYPLKEIKDPVKQEKAKFRRLPNGFGSIKRLSGRRRKPYMCLPTVKEYEDNGNPIYQGIIGYYETYEQAYLALADYNKKGGIGGFLTFSDVYEKWFNDKYILNKKRTYSDSLVTSTKSAYKNCSAIHDKAISEIKLDDLQNIIDKCTLKHSSQELIVGLLHQVFDYAVKYDYVEKDYSKYVKIRIADDDEKGVPFTEDEIKILWDHKENADIQIILMMIYTGFRIRELETLTLDVKERCFRGGLKTEAGKNRVVPIHDCVWEYAKSFDSALFNAKSWRIRHFYPVMKKLGLENTEKGLRHTPHDCRHTFSWLCDISGVDATSKHIIMGHSLQGDVEKTVYSHRTVEDLRKEIAKIVTI